MTKPTKKEINDWENRLIDATVKARFDGDAHDLAHLCSELLGRLREASKERK